MPLPVKIVGGGILVPGTELFVDPVFGAGRFSPRPLDYTLQGQNLGHYAIVGFTTAIAPAANAIVFAARWTDTQVQGIIQSLSVSVAVVTAVTAQRLDPIVATIARGYTARDLTNAAALTISGQNQKKATKMGSSRFGNIDTANAAAGLTGGTKTLDANAVGMAGLSGTAIAGLGTGLLNTFLLDPQMGDGEHPPQLAANEGVVVSWGPTALATGTVIVAVKMRWAEVMQF